MKAIAERGRSGEAFSVANPCLTANKQNAPFGEFFVYMTQFSASTLGVILQRLMPFYRMRQTGESTTLLLKATPIFYLYKFIGKFFHTNQSNLDSFF